MVVTNEFFFWFIDQHLPGTHVRQETFWLMCAEVLCALAITEWYSLELAVMDGGDSRMSKIVKPLEHQLFTLWQSNLAMENMGKP
jgi:hypothetical protein